MYIHYFSYHSIQIKSNIIVNMMIRALRICDPVFLDQETEHIYTVFTKLCYPRHIINKAISRARRQYYMPKPKFQFDHKNAITLPYHTKLTKLKSIFHKSGKFIEGNPQIVFNYTNTVSAKLISNKDKGNKKIEKGVYKIPCNDCSESYFGETGRNLNIRIEEHKRACRLGLPNSMVAKHTLELGHRIDWENIGIVYSSSDIGKRRVVEGALINLCRTFDNNKAFTQENQITNFLICKMSTPNMLEFFVAPSVRSPLLSPSQALGVDHNSTDLNAGADAVATGSTAPVDISSSPSSSPAPASTSSLPSSSPALTAVSSFPTTPRSSNIETPIIIHQPPSRRSRRIAALNNRIDDIT